jgi:hypothetical protein
MLADQRSERLLNKPHVCIDLRSGGHVGRDSNGKHGEFGVKVTDRACVRGSLGNGTTEVA